MAEWTIDISSVPGILPADQGADDVLEQLAAAIEADPAALGPAVSANTATGTVGGIYQVDAASFFDAMHLGQSIWLAAMQRVGMPPSIGEYEQRPADPPSS